MITTPCIVQKNDFGKKKDDGDGDDGSSKKTQEKCDRNNDFRNRWLRSSPRIPQTPATSNKMINPLVRAIKPKN
jgi:hypothetical protein